MRKALCFLSILSDSDLDWIIRHGSKQRVPVGAVLIRQRQPIDSLYFVLEGEFEVFTNKAPLLAVLRAGEIMGEVSYVDSRPPTASVRAMIESEVGAVPRELLTTKLSEDTEFSSRLYRAMATFMADRLRTTVGNFGTGALELEDDVDDSDEAATHLVDDVSLAMARFSEMQRRNWGAQRAASGI